ncbi:hydrolase 1, exosortase A system-associated [Pseudoduganella namucuonensis]|uniref:Exosortase A system-associated hydrolase 1 n=1 Tax=Pseudoduganella namucuonensis TaxID=1035707 RepID=A0A1I7GGT0_9BURK|nr:hydrolase 1, exosortase A system-associated [Pseudoduganella namucuonensis]SFU47654.1 exosortase A system-associated hydrolase 1 [Pseudoduganella namucuonensis]
MLYEEVALSFSCRGDALLGIVSVPERPSRRGVLVLVGGAQYRAGSHRQFTLLARCLAQRGIPVMRFDYRGMGDGEGSQRSFEDIADDLRAAIDQFMAGVPGLSEVVLWGLCDAASAALFYAARDARVRGLALLNPWARAEAGLAKTVLKRYYLRRLGEPALWRKVFSGRFDFLASAASLGRHVAAVLPGRRALAGTGTAPPLAERLYAGLYGFGGPVLLILSPDDMTAMEFMEMAGGSPRWRALMAAPRVTRRELAGADHTFSSRVWRDQVADWTGTWLLSW